MMIPKDAARAGLRSLSFIRLWTIAENRFTIEPPDQRLERSVAGLASHDSILGCAAGATSMISAAMRARMCLQRRMVSRPSLSRRERRNGADVRIGCVHGGADGHIQFEILPLVDRLVGFLAL